MSRRRRIPRKFPSQLARDIDRALRRVTPGKITKHTARTLRGRIRRAAGGR